MAKIKLTTQELKRQKIDLKRYQRFLPTLTLKKLQLQIEINKARATLDRKTREQVRIHEEIRPWMAVLGEDAGITEIVRIDAVETEKGNVAGVEIPTFKAVRFKAPDYDLYSTPLWVDGAVEVLQRLLTLRAEILVLEQQIASVERELRITIQRVNLFEKIKIPETEENIRVIQIFLGDQQTAAVVRGKLAKAKVSQRTGRSSDS